MNINSHTLESIKSLPTIQEVNGDHLKYDDVYINVYIRIWLCADNSIDIETWGYKGGEFSRHSTYKVSASG